MEPAERGFELVRDFQLKGKGFFLFWWIFRGMWLKKTDVRWSANVCAFSVFVRAHVPCVVRSGWEEFVACLAFLAAFHRE
jgi:hypothetical protein